MSVAKAQNALSIKQRKLLIVEGRDEEQMFGALLGHLRLTDVQVLAIGGKTKLQGNLAALVNDPRFPAVEAIVIVRDADYPGLDAAADAPAAASAWTSVCAVLQNASLPAPTEHGAFSSGSPRTAIFLLPDGTSDGMLEDLCLTAFSVDPAFPCTDSYFSCLASAGITHKTKDQAKARIHALLASRPEPDLRLGEAASRGYLPFDAPAFAPLVALLRAL